MLNLVSPLALLERLKAYAGSALVIVVMHDLDLALRFCDRLVLLDRGRVAAKAMLADPAFAKAFGLRLQAEPRRADRDWVIGLG